MAHPHTNYGLSTAIATAWGKPHSQNQSQNSTAISSGLPAWPAICSRFITGVGPAERGFWFPDQSMGGVGACFWVTIWSEFTCFCWMCMLLVNVISKASFFTKQLSLAFNCEIVLKASFIPKETPSDTLLSPVCFWFFHAFDCNNAIKSTHLIVFALRLGTLNPYPKHAGIAFHSVHRRKYLWIPTHPALLRVKRSLGGGGSSKPLPPLLGMKTTRRKRYLRCNEIWLLISIGFDIRKWKASDQSDGCVWDCDAFGLSIEGKSHSYTTHMLRMVNFTAHKTMSHL